MPTETCRECVRLRQRAQQARPRPDDYYGREALYSGAVARWQTQYPEDSLRSGTHHGTGCRFGRCTEHCSCSREAQTDFRVFVRGTRSTAFRCSDCGNSTNHVCIQTSEANSRDGTRRPISIRRCGRCCTNIFCATACESRIQQELFACASCARIVENFNTWIHQVNGVRYCVICVNGGGCHQCGAVNERADRCEECNACITHERDGIPARQEYDYNNPPPLEHDTLPFNTTVTARLTPNRDSHCRCALQEHEDVVRMGRPRLRSVQHVSFQFADGAATCDENPVPRAIGVELEIAGFHRPTTRQLTELWNAAARWNASIGTDGSIHTESGIEIRTAPAAGQHFITQVDQLLHHVGRAAGFVNDNCGFHVHVDCRDLSRVWSARTDDDPQRLLDLRAHGFLRGIDLVCYAYFLCEPVFYQMVHSRRAGWQYCQRWARACGPNDYTSIANLIVQCPSRITQEGWTSVFHRVAAGTHGRYQGLNTSALSSHKTLEFRLHEGTVDPARVKAWAIMCANFVHTLGTHANPLEVVRELQEVTPTEFMHRLAPTAAVRDMIEAHAPRRPNRAARRRAA